MTRHDMVRLMMTLNNIQELPLSEKFLMMETLWESISPYENELTLPQWHRDLLDEREKFFQQKKAHFIDWKIAKKQIQEAIA